jgi:hypothetical protein
LLTGVVGGGIRPAYPAVGPGVHPVLMASVPTWGERLEFSHGLVAALGEPLTLRLGRLAADPDLNPPQPPDPTRAEHDRLDGKIGRDGDPAAVTLPLPPLFS